MLKLLQVGVLKVEQKDDVEEQPAVRHISEGEKLYGLVSKERHKVCKGMKGPFEGKEKMI
ncbi:hypothetical protein KY285_023787 [Solanum tuberosum]|nr:hypothetical protein KY285_023787 [Solanum tuberosum]